MQQIIYVVIVRQDSKELPSLSNDFLFSHFTWVPTCNHLGFKDLFLMEILTVAAAAVVVFRHVPALAFCHWLQCWSQPLPELCLLLLLLLLLVQFAFSCNFCLFSYLGVGGGAALLWVWAKLKFFFNFPGFFFCGGCCCFGLWWCSLTFSLFSFMLQVGDICQQLAPFLIGCLFGFFFHVCSSGS